MFNRKMLAETLGLSCVEKHFLNWLSDYYDIKKLYACSFLSIKRLFKDFSCGATYANYNVIPRLQDLAEEYGIVKHTYISCNAKEVSEIMSKCGENDLCLVRVNTNFFINFKRASWREDHYLRVDRGMNWLNDYPLMEGRFDVSEFPLIFDGGVCIYRSVNDRVDPADENIPAIINQDFTDIPDLNLHKMQDVLGILRITRRRIKEYYGECEEISKILSEEIKYLDKAYLDVRRLILRKETSAETNSIKIRIIEFEKEFAEGIRCQQKK